MEHQWSKAYKPKRKLYVLRSRESEGFDDFCQENGYDWYKCFSNIYRPLANRALFYMPEKMMDAGYSRLCGGVEIGYSDMEMEFNALWICCLLTIVFFLVYTCKDIVMTK